MSPYGGFRRTSISDLIAPRGSGFFGESHTGEGPVEYVHVDLGQGRSLTCIESAIVFITSEERSSCAPDLEWT
jgi:hypothetical protein